MFWSKLDRLAILTVGYSGVFRFPLTTKEIWLRLIFGSGVSLDQLMRGLSHLGKLGLITKVGRYWVPTNESKRRVLARSSGKLVARSKMAQAKSLVSLAQRLPWVRGLAITGSVAVMNAAADDDVDFWVITSPHGLWLTRLVLSWFARTKQKRRGFSRSGRDSWCFNFWLSTNHMVVPESKHNLYSAYEALQAEWLVDKDQLRYRFLLNNRWIGRYLPHYFSFAFKSYHQPPETTRNQLLSYAADWLFLPLNVFAYLIQRIYMQQHITRELVGYGFAYFHPRDTKGLIYRRWQRFLLQWLS